MNGTSTINFGHCPVTGAAGYTGSHLVNSESAGRYLGFRPIKSVTVGMTKCAAHYLDEG